MSTVAGPSGISRTLVVSPQRTPEEQDRVLDLVAPARMAPSGDGA